MFLKRDIRMMINHMREAKFVCDRAFLQQDIGRMTKKQNIVEMVV